MDRPNRNNKRNRGEGEDVNPRQRKIRRLDLSVEITGPGFRAQLSLSAVSVQEGAATDRSNRGLLPVEIGDLSEEEGAVGGAVSGRPGRSNRGLSPFKIKTYSGQEGASRVAPRNTFQLYY